MPISIIFEDSDLLVIYKPAGLVVEKDETVKKTDQTLEDILIAQYKIDLPRGGIVHRLDRDTSGIMVVAKNEASLVHLQNQFASHLVEKKYIAMVYGDLLPKKGTINIALKRDPKNRTRFVPGKGLHARSAITHYSVVKNILIAGKVCSLVEVELETGRTHQIRAHFAGINFPIIGDSVYFNKGSEMLSEKLNLKRQFLHAEKLAFTHPKTGKKVSFVSELPQELQDIIQ
ncbi:MAG: RluA family pseudouridine synthase [Patescibacteria group bacterium]